MRSVCPPTLFRELLRLLTGIDLDFVYDARDRAVVQRISEDYEILGRRLRVSGESLRILRRLYEDQQPRHA